MKDHTRDGDWQVWRQDDAGNQYLVATGLSNAEAERLIAEYERRGHKQLYWIQRLLEAREI